MESNKGVAAIGILVFIISVSAMGVWYFTRKDTSSSPQSTTRPTATPTTNLDNPTSPTAVPTPINYYKEVPFNSDSWERWATGGTGKHRDKEFSIELPPHTTGSINNTINLNTQDTREVDSPEEKDNAYLATITTSVVDELDQETGLNAAQQNQVDETWISKEVEHPAGEGKYRLYRKADGTGFGSIWFEKDGYSYIIYVVAVNSDNEQEALDYFEQIAESFRYES